jgi:SAM-dependent MidA family methyltransferase
VSDALHAALAAGGPLRLDRFMALANAAYYASRDPFGRAGDFITAPEITQAFGELLGLWAAAVWQAMGAPPRVTLAELGPGRGTLMADALRAIARAAPGFREAASVHLVETSAALRAAQAARLGAAVAAWHEGVEALPEGPLILLANEFLDALPIRRFRHGASGWEEAAVARAGEGLSLAWVAAAPPADIKAAGGGEVCEAGRALAATLGARFSHAPGAALFLDYGPAEATPDDSLQAVRGHGAADPFAAPGEVDLSAHVDFRAFASAARMTGAAVQGPVPQGEFLRRLGLPERTAILCRAARPDQAASLQAGARRLMDADAMGLLFKAICLCDVSLPPLPGLAP